MSTAAAGAVRPPRRPRVRAGTRGQAGSRGRAGSWGRAAGLVLAWLLLFGLTATWSLGTPLSASPDEPAHTIKALAVARGQLSGDLGPVPVDWTVPGALTTVQIPSGYAAASDTCYARQPDESAACQAPLRTDAGPLVDATTPAGQYPPLYYWLVGLPSLVLAPDRGMHAMRLVSAAAASLMIVWGLRALWGRGSPRIAAWSAAVALTPMSLFLAGTVNPNGLEIAAAFSLWAAGLALLSGRSTQPLGSRWLQVAVSAAVLVNIRALSALWAAVVLALCLLAADRGALRRAVGSRWAVPAVLVMVAASAVGVAWTVRHGALLHGEDIWPQYRDTGRALRDMLWGGETLYLQMIGNFGWFDTPSPPLTVYLWTGAVGAAGALALALPGAVRGRLALGVLVVGVCVGPMVAQLPSVEDTGLVWQGRYTLPVAVGVPLLAGALLTGARTEALTLARRLAGVLLPLLGVAHVLAFYWAMRRYGVGETRELLTEQPTWTSPLGYLPAVGLHAALVVALVALALVTSRRSGTPQDSPEPQHHARPGSLPQPEPQPQPQPEPLR
ncbi:DUF2142 domain-containing protein [Cellulomonas aerilata]|uniref:Glycosyltransferase RgtA/B/C/D-like domain-containing protein n=1 Tax=Cellulomonas aerilata TaxID=515326 RepID=A0A512DH39_9CELL|nr:DUF2142 domain-containing protein [Cellulomonas aerilata]GEO35799.1 hypothetical protein CAE01nite_35240 [Cellulomonas aerilata]